MFGRTSIYTFFIFYAYLLQKPTYLRNLIAPALVLTNTAVAPLKGS